MTNISDLLLFYFAATGMTLLLVRSTIFEPFRVFLAQSVERMERERAENNLPHRFTVVEFLHKMFQSAQCIGFCCGLFCGLFILSSDLSYSGYIARMTPLSPSFNDWSASFIYKLRVFRWVMLLFCCGVAGSFFSSLGDLLLQWIYASKELKTKQLLQEKNKELENQE
ncbi:MAG: hypothetical protein LBP87_13715 [Planctomycetaceae bacterium]|jgi:hypothetical protein|nr:hypothetical protein [Planctomycetaceae bacterium]